MDKDNYFDECNQSGAPENRAKTKASLKETILQMIFAVCNVHGLGMEFGGT